MIMHAQEGTLPISMGVHVQMHLGEPVQVDKSERVVPWGCLIVGLP